MTAQPDESNVAGRGFTHEPPAGGSPEWYTPPEIFHALGLDFDLDPCAPPMPAAAWIPAAARYCLPVDGLQEPWSGRVWLNPPYAAETARWVGRLGEHGHGIALVFVRSCTPWWQSAVSRATAVCFIAGRVNFREGSPDQRRGRRRDSRAGAPSCLIAFGDDCADALRGSALGLVLAPTVDRRLELAV